MKHVLQHRSSPVTLIIRLQCLIYCARSRANICLTAIFVTAIFDRSPISAQHLLTRQSLKKKHSNSDSFTQANSVIGSQVHTKIILKSLSENTAKCPKINYKNRGKTIVKRSASMSSQCRLGPHSATSVSKRHTRIFTRTIVAKSLDPSCFASKTTNNVRVFLQNINCG